MQHNPSSSKRRKLGVSELRVLLALPSMLVSCPAKYSADQRREGSECCERGWMARGFMGDPNAPSLSLQWPKTAAPAAGANPKGVRTHPLDPDATAGGAQSLPSLPPRPPQARKPSTSGQGTPSKHWLGLLVTTLFAESTNLKSPSQIR